MNEPNMDNYSNYPHYDNPEIELEIEPDVQDLRYEEELNETK